MAAKSVDEGEYIDQIVTDGGGFGLVLRVDTERVCGYIFFPSDGLNQLIEDSYDDP